MTSFRLPNCRGSAVLAGLFMAMVSLLAVTCISAACLRTASRLKVERMDLRQAAESREKTALALTAFDLTGQAGIEPLSLAEPSLALLRQESTLAVLIVDNRGRLKRPSWQSLRSASVPEFRCHWTNAPPWQNGPAAAAAARTCELTETPFEHSTFIPGNTSVRGNLKAAGLERVTLSVMGSLNVLGDVVIDDAVSGEVEIVAAGDISFSAISFGPSTTARVRIASATGTIRIAAPLPASDCLQSGPKLRLEAGRNIEAAGENLGRESGCDFPYAPRQWPNLKIAGETWAAAGG